jgi:hypothetical protein
MPLGALIGAAADATKIAAFIPRRIRATGHGAETAPGDWQVSAKG